MKQGLRRINFSKFGICRHTPKKPLSINNKAYNFIFYLTNLVAFGSLRYLNDLYLLNSDISINAFK